MHHIQHVMVHNDRNRLNVGYFVSFGNAILILTKQRVMCVCACVINEFDPVLCSGQQVLKGIPASLGAVGL